MDEEGKITMNEFKTVVERFEDNQKKIVEVMDQRFKHHDKRMDTMMKEIATLHEGQTAIKLELKTGLSSAKEERSAMKEQISLLHKGQTAIRSDLHEKASFKEVKDLQKRVTRLENKVV